MREFWLISAVLALASPVAALGQAAPDIDVQQRVMGSASDLPSTISAMSAADLEAYTTGVRNGIMRVWASHGVNLSPTDVRITSQVIDFASQKLIRSAVVIPGKSYQFVFMGVVQRDIVGIFCTSKTIRPFDPKGTACERKMMETFGRGSKRG